MIKKISLLLFVLFVPAVIYAEAVFLKDGSIVEGEIVSENDREAVLRTGRGQQQRVLRKDILRIAYDDRYRNKVYIYLMNGELVEGYIVAEDRDEYIIRENINSEAERALKKKNVNVIAKQKIGAEKGASLVDNVTARETWVIGGAIYYDFSEKYFTNPEENEAVIQIQSWYFFKRNQALGLEAEMQWWKNNDPSGGEMTEMYMRFGAGYQIYPEFIRLGRVYPSFILLAAWEQGRMVNESIGFSEDLGYRLFGFDAAIGATWMVTDHVGIYGELARFRYNIFYQSDTPILSDANFFQLRSMIGIRAHIY